jgi:hypothetical protein
MGNDAYDRTAAGFFQQFDRRLKALERRLPPTIPPQTRGTIAQRDALFGVPTTDAQKSALANERPTWYHTDKGWTEGYYAVTGTTGLTVPGLLAGNTSGWYPIAGSGLRAHRGKTNGFQAISASTNTDPILATMDINVGGFTDYVNSGITVPVGGFYRVHANIYFTGGVSDYVATLVFRSGTHMFGSTVPKPNLSDVQVGATDVIPMQSGQNVGSVAVASGAVSVYGTTGYNGSRILVEYAGPPLVNG